MVTSGTFLADADVVLPRLDPLGDEADGGLAGRNRRRRIEPIHHGQHHRGQPAKGARVPNMTHVVTHHVLQRLLLDRLVVASWWQAAVWGDGGEVKEDVLDARQLALMRGN